MATSPLRITRSMNLVAASCSAPSRFRSLPLVSMSSPSVMGNVTSLEKKAIFCSWLSS
jgi:hypothetical protein